MPPPPEAHAAARPPRQRLVTATSARKSSLSPQTCSTPQRSTAASPAPGPPLPKEEASGVLARDTLFTGPRPASPVSCPLSWAPPAPARPICSRRLPTAFNHASPSASSSPPRPPARHSAEYLTHTSSFNLHHHPHFVYDEAKAERMSLSNSPSVRGRIETQVAMPLTSTLYCPLCYRAGVSEDSLGAGAL